MGALAGLRIGLFTWRQRSLLARALLFTTATLVGLPLLLLALLVGATGAMSGGPAAPAPPMRTWVVTQPFGCTGLPFEGPRGGCHHFHTGIDLAAPLGSAVYAVLPGSARVVPAATGFGLHILLLHAGGYLTIYGHLLGAAVQSGDSVLAGQLIAYEGSSGNSTGPHLHFEVRVGETPLDPVQAFPALFAGSATNTTGATPGTNNQTGRATPK
jgi:murein DD-endopeptidase MepM/ murein hydrolase activator NlpD